MLALGFRVVKSLENENEKYNRFKMKNTNHFKMNQVQEVLKY